MPSECCDEYKLIQLYQKSSVWCFAFSHTSTFELIPAVATALPGALVTVAWHDMTWLTVRHVCECDVSTPRTGRTSSRHVVCRTVSSMTWHDMTWHDWPYVMSVCLCDVARCACCPAACINANSDRHSCMWRNARRSRRQAGFDDVIPVWRHFCCRRRRPDTRLRDKTVSWVELSWLIAIM